MLEKIISEMFLKVYNRRENHFKVKKTFPRECFTEICEALTRIDELNFSENKNIFADVSLRKGIVSVSFTYFSNVSCEELPYERMIKEQYNTLIEEMVEEEL